MSAKGKTLRMIPVCPVLYLPWSEWEWDFSNSISWTTIQPLNSYSHLTCRRTVLGRRTYNPLAYTWTPCKCAFDSEGLFAFSFLPSGLCLFFQIKTCEWVHCHSARVPSPIKCLAWAPMPLLWTCVHPAWQSLSNYEWVGSMPSHDNIFYGFYLKVLWASCLTFIFVKGNASRW